MIYAIIPVKDRLDLTRNVIEDCRRDSMHPIVCDNGSGKATRNWLASQEDVTTIDCAGMGIHEMWNIGAFRALAYDPQANLAFLNNDIRFERDAFDATVVEVMLDDDLWVACPNYDGREGKGVEYVTGICAGRYDGTGGIAGFGFVVDRRVFLSGYRFPVEAKWWFGDTDLVATVNAGGGRCGILLDARMTHVDGGGQTGDWVALSPRLKADREWFESKWGGGR